MSKRVLLAINPRARRGDSARERAHTALRDAGHTVTVLPALEGPAELSEAIASYAGAIDVVAVGGGDGTLISAIAGLRATALPLLILPLGTVNELARTLAIPFDLVGACALLDGGARHAIDVGCVNGHWFFNEASIGLSTHVAREQTEEVKDRFGIFSVLVATLRSLGSMRPYRLHIETERGLQTFRTVQLTVANSYRFGTVVEDPDARIDDGLLDLYSIDVRHWWDAFTVIAAVARKRFPKARCVTGLRGTHFVVRARHKHRVFADGEPATQTPAEFSIAPRAIEIFVPPSGATE